MIDKKDAAVERNSFLLYCDYAQYFNLLSMEDRGYLISAIFAYQIDGTEPKELSPAAEMAFLFIRTQLDRDNEKYIARCERNRANGTKGGRPSKQTESKETQENPEKPNGFSENPENPIYDICNMIYDNDSNINITTTGEKTARFSVPYEKIKNLYNEICVSFPRCTKLSEARKKAIHARFSSGMTEEDFRTLFEKAEASAFLKGKNDKHWQASFDWLICDANMTKTIDGNYDNKNGGDQNGAAESMGQAFPNYGITV